MGCAFTAIDEVLAAGIAGRAFVTLIQHDIIFVWVIAGCLVVERPGFGRGERVSLGSRLIAFKGGLIQGNACHLQVLAQQKVRHLQGFAEIVKAFQFVIGRKQFRRIGNGDIDVQEIPNRVAVLGAVEASEQDFFRMMGYTGDPFPQDIDDFSLLVRTWLRLIFRRHFTIGDSIHNCLPRFGVVGILGVPIQRIKTQLPLLLLRAMTLDAVGLEERSGVCS